jgi:hypothetical protein
VLGLVPLSGGEIELFGVPRAKFKHWARVGYVPQRIGAGSGVPATVGEVVASGRLARRGIFRLPGAADKAAVLAALTDVAHDDRIADQGAVPAPVGHHAEKGHDHVHPHAAPEHPVICVAPTDRVTN